MSNSIKEQRPLEQRPFGLYIHWPFCASKCPYCDFNSHVSNAIDYKAWEKALLLELGYVGAQTKGRTLTSVFFGGGTPSLMPPSLVASLIDSLATYWHLDTDLEITLEGNPGSIELLKYKDFKHAGINRVSVGIQSLRSESLQFLGRTHSELDSRKALEVTRTLFDRSNFDLIYALPGQTPDQWQQELEEALMLAQDHLSLYQLIIEPGTAFYTRHQRGEFLLPSDEISAQMFENTTTFMASKGYDFYEVSNFAKDHSYCRHNLVYWEYDDYVCIGPGAHGRVTLEGQKVAVRNHRAPDIWLNTTLTQGHGQKEVLALPKQEQITEHLLMNLRLTSGIQKDHFKAQHGMSLDDLIPMEKRQFLQNLGMIEDTATHLKVTEKGMLRLNGIIEDLACAVILPS